MTMQQDARSPRRFGLTGNALKVIAIIAMTVDHLAWMGIEEYSQAENALQIMLHSFGRLRWLGKFFYWYYPAHMALIGLIIHVFPA